MQRACACGKHSDNGGECTECRKKRLGLHRRAVAGERGQGPDVAPPIVHEVLRSLGRPLDEGTRGFMESRFGQDFSSVRVHIDDRAAESARAVNALAYTVGNHVAFDSGRYAPGTSAGRGLLAHELAHTVQQRGTTAKPGTRLPISRESTLERQAETAGKATNKPGDIRPIRYSATGVQRQVAGNPNGAESGSTDLEPDIQSLLATDSYVCHGPIDFSQPERRRLRPQEIAILNSALHSARRIVARARLNLGLRDQYSLQMADRTIGESLTHAHLIDQVARIQTKLDSLVVDETLFAGTCHTRSCREFIAFTEDNLREVVLCPEYFGEIMAGAGSSAYLTLIHEAGHMADIDAARAQQGEGETYCGDTLNFVNCADVCPNAGQRPTENVEAWTRLIYCIALSR